MFRDLQGVVSGSARVAGTPGEPELTGSMRLGRASLEIPDLGVRAREGQARVTLKEEEVRIDSLRIRSGDGVLRGSGAVAFSRMEPPGFDLTFRTDQFEALSRSDMNATVSGQMQVSGTAEAPSLTGRVEVARGELYLGDLVSSSNVEPVILEEEDYRELARVFGYRPPSAMGSPSNLWDSTAVDLDVRLGRASWIRQRSNPEMAVQFTGQLEVNKERGDSLRLLGRVEGVPGRSYVEQFGRRFTLASGELAFRGPPAATEIDLSAEYEVPSRDNPDAPEVVITLDLDGTADDLNLELSSTPRLAASDVVSYLVAGRPANQVLASRDDGGGGGGLTGAGGALALAQVSAAVETYAREEVGLDVVEITTDGLDGVTLLAGRYLSPDLYLGIRQPLSFQRASGDTSERTPNPEVELELEAVRWLLLNLQAGGSSGVELFVRSRIAYE
jgi:translocation and assembly module TamB